VLVGSCAIVALVGAGTTASPGQQADPIADADQAVAEAQAQVDQVAGAYFDALEHARQLDARIADLQTRIDELGQKVAQLRHVTSDRAVAAYKRAGNSLESVFFDSTGATDAARRAKLLQLLNGNDEAVATALRKARDDLSHERTTLEAAREDQASAVARLHDEEQQVDAKLVAAQTQRKNAIDQQIQAQQAAAAAAAAAATAPAAQPSPSTAPPAPAPSPPSTSKPALTPVPAGYTPTGGVSPHHDDPYLTCVRHYESGGNYQAYNPGGPAYGAYQFLQPTWNVTANHAGRGDLVGIDPRRASAYDQDEMAWALYQWQGKRPWSADPC
jgi:TolA-binding protein